MRLYKYESDEFESICTLTSDINKCWIGEYHIESYLYFSDIGVYYIRIPGITIGKMILDDRCMIESISFASDILDNFTEDLLNIPDTYKGTWVDIKPIY